MSLYGYSPQMSEIDELLFDELLFDELLFNKLLF